MCGRFLLTTPISEIRRLFVADGDFQPAPRHNVAPGQGIVVVRAGPRAREVAELRWGLVPSWAAGPDIGARLINARAETLAGKPSFRAAFRARRALVPADGYYEWQGSKGRKRPFVIRRRDRRVMAFAALWERWHDLETVTIITTAANAALAHLHDRMPAIVDDGDWTGWLSAAAAPDDLARLLVPAPESWLDAVEVGERVNSVRNEGPLCLEPPHGQATLF